ncbi:hypothetical protein [Pandoraea sp.]|uniref:hypothetical protein n=1 Tax=Pandoraea sp. TaxID=1883445 RepID=UPI00121AEF98|nr:hypothetical protein [Pandoraea sp.]TAL56787.1 MAG: hypothetical protein EPN80_02100 [Pandoraea sp.]TAM15612.1 MAG: hypothetical protein EPN65_17870 [Pandoraea sp.]
MKKANYFVAAMVAAMAVLAMNAQARENIGMNSGMQAGVASGADHMGASAGSDIQVSPSQHPDDRRVAPPHEMAQRHDVRRTPMTRDRARHRVSGQEIHRSITRQHAVKRSVRRDIRRDVQHAVHDRTHHNRTM